MAGRPRKEQPQDGEFLIETKSTEMETPQTEKPKHVFGLKGHQKGRIDENGKPVFLKGVESELIGTGEGLKRYQQFLIKLDMAERL